VRCALCLLLPRPVSPFTVAIWGLKVVGSSVGTEEETGELFEMVIKGDVVPHIEARELSELDAVQSLAQA
jgi:D-arabinose 1-dehydrogenase-like Zn-dependent alcohol dehydrogenase